MRSVKSHSIKPIWKEFNWPSQRLGDPEVNRILAEACQEGGIFYCLADEPDSGDFIIPSSGERGDIQFAISTSGTAPAYAKRLRQDIEKSFPDDIDDYVAFLAQARREVRKRVNDSSRRRMIAEHLASREGYNKYCQLTKQQQLDWIEQIVEGEISS